MIDNWVTNIYMLDGKAIYIKYQMLTLIMRAKSKATKHWNKSSPVFSWSIIVQAHDE